MHNAYNNFALVLMIGAVALGLFLLAKTMPGGAFGGMMPAFSGVTGSSRSSWLAPLHNARVNGRNKGDVALWTHANNDKTGEGGAGGGGAALDERINKNLEKLESRFAQLDKLEKSVAEGKASQDKITDAVAEIQKSLLEIRKLGIAARGNRPAQARLGMVSDECARYLGALALGAAITQGKVEGQTAQRYLAKMQEILGAEHKTALSSTDIPLPTEYGGEVVELVSQYGIARQYGTVFPLGSGVVKLPRLKTDPAVVLIAASGTVTEKSPQTEWVTFTAEKFGAIVRLPTELDDDSIVPLGQFIARYFARNIAKSEDYNFFVSTGAGSGVNGSVKGLCVSVNSANNAKTTVQASTKTKYSDMTLANLRSIRGLVDAPAIRSGKYYMHPSFEQALSGLNASGDKPYQAMAGKNPTLDGYEIVWVDVMPAYDTSAHATSVYVLFGDLSYQYLGVRGGVRLDTSKEAGFTTDEILVRGLERFTIGLMAVGAVSGLETAAS